VPINPLWRCGAALAEWTGCPARGHGPASPRGTASLDQEADMGKGGRKSRARRKNKANHGKRPNA